MGHRKCDRTDDGDQYLSGGSGKMRQTYGRTMYGAAIFLRAAKPDGKRNEEDNDPVSGGQSDRAKRKESECRLNERRADMRRCWSILSTLLLILLILLLIAFGGVRLAGLTPFVVTSGSMEPEYPVGSLVYVKDKSAKEIKEGDVITFYLEDGQTVATHQVYEVDAGREEFRTQGINNRDSEGNILHDAAPVKYDSLIGCPVMVIPHLGYVNQFCTTAPGVYILVGIAVAVLLISVIIDNTAGEEAQPEKRRRRRKRRRK